VAITEWFNGSKLSPITGLELESTNLVPAHALRNAIEEYCTERYGTPLRQEDLTIIQDAQGSLTGRQNNHQRSSETHQKSSDLIPLKV
jgi:hypothetical protein